MMKGLTACAVQHGFNCVLMLGELFLNSIPFYPYLLGFVGLWTCSYGIWAFINFSSSGKWMYPVSSIPEQCYLQSVWSASEHDMVLHHMSLLRSTCVMAY